MKFFSLKSLGILLLFKWTKLTISVIPSRRGECAFSSVVYGKFKNTSFDPGVEQVEIATVGNTSFAPRGGVLVYNLCIMLY